MKLTPGLVGGHCISIDPYYLMYKSDMSGYTPNIMRAARKINDEMDQWVLTNFLKFAKQENIDLDSIKITILGYTFKENCNDTRNTKVHDLLLSMQAEGLSFNIWDPLLTVDQKNKLNEINIESHIEKPENIQIAFVCVYHNQIIEFLNNFKGIVYDYKKLVIKT